MKEEEIFKDKNPFPEQYAQLTPITERLSEGRMSPKDLRGMCDEYREAGIVIQEVEGSPQGKTTFTEEGEIKVQIPKIEPFGPDATAVHELVEVEHILRGLGNGLEPTDFKDVPPHQEAASEIGAREAEIRYIGNLPFFTRLKPAYKDRRQQALDAIKKWSEILPEGAQLTEKEKINPYQKVVEAEVVTTDE